MASLERLGAFRNNVKMGTLAKRS